MVIFLKCAPGITWLLTPEALVCVARLPRQNIHGRFSDTLCRELPEFKIFPSESYLSLRELRRLRVSSQKLCALYPNRSAQIHCFKFRLHVSKPVTLVRVWSQEYSILFPIILNWCDEPPSNRNSATVPLLVQMDYVPTWSGAFSLISFRRGNITQIGNYPKRCKHGAGNREYRDYAISCSGLQQGLPLRGAQLWAQNMLWIS